MDQTDVGLQSVVKALTDTVAGAIDPTDHLAREQLRLAASYVDFVRQRLHLIHARERFDLNHYIALGRDLLSIGMPEGTVPVTALQSATSVAQAVAVDPAAMTYEIRATAMELAHVIANLVQEVHRSAPERKAFVDRAVVAASETKLEMERLWYQPVGFDPSPPAGVSVMDYLRSPPLRPLTG